MSTLDATRKDFLFQILGCKPLTKFGRNTDFGNADEALRDYLRREQKVITDIGILEALPGGDTKAVPHKTETTKTKQSLEPAKALKDASKIKQIFKTAYTSLETTKKGVRTDILELNAKTLEVARHKPIYEERLRILLAGLKKIEGRPGVTKEVTALNNMKKAALQHAANTDYLEASEALEDVQSTVNEGVKKSLEFSATAGSKAFQKSVKQANAAAGKFLEIAGLADPEFIRDRVERYEAALKKVEVTPAKEAEAIQELDKIAEEITTRLSLLEDQQKQAVKLRDESKLLIDGDVKMSAPLSVFQDLHTRMAAAETLVSTQQYEKAVTELTPLKAELTTAKDTYKPHRDNWLDQKGKVEKLRPKVATGANPMVLKITSVIENRLPRLTEETDRTHEFEAAAKEAAEMLAKLEKIKSTPGDYTALDRDYNTLVNGGDAEIEKAQQKIDELKGQGGDISEFQAQLNSVGGKWNATKGIVEKPEELVPIQTHHDSTLIPALTKLKADVQEILDDKKVKLPASKKAGAEKALEKEWNKVKRDLGEQLAMLEVKAPESAKPIRKSFTTLVNGFAQKKTAGKGDESLRDLKVLQRGVDVALQGAATVSARKAKPGLDKAIVLLKTLKELSTANATKDYKPFFDTLVDEVGDAQALLETGVDASIDAGLLAINQLETKVNAAKTPPTDKSYAKLDEKYKGLKKKLKGASVLKEVLPSKHKVLTYRLTNEVKEAYKQKSPTEAFTLLVKFDSEVTNAMQLATTTNTARTKLKERAEVLKTAIKEISEAPKLQADLLKRVAAAAAPGENGEDAASVELDSLDILVEQAKTPGKKALLEKKATEDGFAIERAKAEYEAKLDLFEHGPKAEASKVKDKTDSADLNKTAYHEIGTAESEAKKFAKALDFQKALDKIIEATGLAQDFIVNPQGEKATARNNLKKVEKLWQSAVAGLVRKVHELKTAVKTASEEAVKRGETGANLPNADKALDAVALLFDADKFAAPFKLLTNKTTPVPKHRQAKENALRFMRAYRKVLKANTVVKHLRTNPFGVEVGPSIKFLEAKLLDLEVNLLTC